MFPGMAQCPLGGRTPLFDGWGRHTQKQGDEEGELVRPPLAPCGRHRRCRGPERGQERWPGQDAAPWGSAPSATR